jgi:hypothetical protein
MADVALRVDHLEEQHGEHKEKLDEIEDRLDTHSTALQRLSIWRDGNGSKGAEVRLQDVETILTAMKTCVDRVTSEDGIARIAQAAVKGVITNAQNRDRTVVSKVRAWAPWFAAGCALAASVVAAVMK